MSGAVKKKLQSGRPLGFLQTSRDTINDCLAAHKTWGRLDCLHILFNPLGSRSVLTNVQPEQQVPDSDNAINCLSGKLV